MVPPVWCELTSADIPHVSIPQKHGKMTAFSIQLPVLALSFGALEGHSKYTLHLECIPINVAFFFNRCVIHKGEKYTSSRMFF